MRIKPLILSLTLAFSLSVALPAAADVVADWGKVVTPITTESTFSFAQYDIDKNFTDQYAFSLEGEAGATYSVSFNFDTCGRGCGNPDLSYGIYNANGGLVAVTDGSSSINLASGNYMFQVKGTGMGSGNNVDYWGSVTFTEATLVSPVPEPGSLLLLVPGIALVRWMSLRRRAQIAGTTAPQSPALAYAAA